MNGNQPVCSESFNIIVSRFGTRLQRRKNSQEASARVRCVYLCLLGVFSRTWTGIHLGILRMTCVNLQRLHPPPFLLLMVAETSLSKLASRRSDLPASIL